MDDTYQRLPFLVTLYQGKNGKPDYDLKRANSEYEKVRGIRSKIIEEALFVESSLTLTIIIFILGDERYRELRLLRSLVFDAEFCTFMQKRKMLSKIFEICGETAICFTEEEGKQLRRSLNDIILERDKYAHGQILIDTLEYKPFIIYYRNGQQKDAVSRNNADQFRIKYRKTELSLAKLRVFLSRQHWDKTHF